MSRIGKKPIPIPEKVEVKLTGQTITVKGAKGTLERNLHPGVNVDVEDNQIVVSAGSSDRKTNALHGLTRSLINNMVEGVSKGFETSLQIQGIGYRAEVSGNKVVFNLGYSHPINFSIPDGIDIVVEKNNIVKVSGIDKEAIGHTAASIRSLRPPEPYKGKGIKYVDEYIQRKAGKTGAK